MYRKNTFILIYQRKYQNENLRVRHRVMEINYTVSQLLPSTLKEQIYQNIHFPEDNIANFVQRYTIKNKGLFHKIYYLKLIQRMFQFDILEIVQLNNKIEELMKERCLDENIKQKNQDLIKRSWLNIVLLHWTSHIQSL